MPPKQSWVAGGSAALIIWILSRSWILSVAIGVWAALVPWGWQMWKAERLKQRLLRQFRSSLQSLTYALEVGVGMVQALERVAHETEEPLQSHWRSLLHELQVGRSLDEALDRFSRRLPLRPVSTFAVAVQITQETGGSLAGVLKTLGASLQEQEALREKIAAITAQGKGSGVLLMTLPFLMMAALGWIAPELVAPLFTTPVGHTLLAAVLFLLTIGGIVMAKIIHIPADSL